MDGVILLPDNLFYNTTAAGVIVVLNKQKTTDRSGKIVLVNASERFEKGRPKNYLSDDVVESLAAAFIKGEQIVGQLAVITREQAELTDYNLSPSRWVEPETQDAATTVEQLLVELSDSPKNREARSGSFIHAVSVRTE